ncbi:cytochrome P450 [Nemania sp. FL0031]|nr:cytochrome P450 [Nemania sp. FL0031]
MAEYLTLITFGIAVCALYLTSLIIYRLYLSPIARIPGSKLAAATGWYETYFDVFRGGQFIFKIEQWHNQYGPIIRINPWEVHISDPDYYDVLYATRSKHSKYEPWKKRMGLEGSTFETTHNSEHNRRRQAVAPFFTRQRVLNYLPYIQKCVDKLCEHIEREYSGKKKPLILDDAYSALTSEVIVYYSFALSYNFLDLPEFKSPFTNAARKVALGVHAGGHFPWILWLQQSMPLSWVGFLNPVLKHVFEFHAELRNQIRNIIAAHEGKAPQQASVYPTVFSDLLDSDLRPEEKNVDLLFAEAGVIIGAGIETTKAALSIASFHILANASVKDRLQQELRAAIPDPISAPPTLAELEKLPYLSGVIQESLRMSFGVTQRLLRMNPQTPIQYGSYVIPPGIVFGMSSYLQHRDPRIFPDPDEFRPERWLGDTTTAGGYPLSKYMVPFGKGPRMCLGMNLAMAELYLAFAHVFTRFDMELFETKRDAVDMGSDYFIPIPKNRDGVRVLVN